MEETGVTMGFNGYSGMVMVIGNGMGMGITVTLERFWDWEKRW